MPPRNLLRAFLALWVVTGVALLVGSIETVRQTLDAHPNPHLVLLGAVEAIAALLFLVPRTTRIGATALVATIAIAFLVHAVLGQFRGDLLVYAAAAAFVGVHRPLTRAQLRAAFR
jgi:uncharacterized membrane protein HdeD (DUF308 family)